MRLAVAILSLAVMSSTPFAIGAESFSRTYDVPTLTMDQEHLAELIDSIDNFIQHANAGIERCSDERTTIEAADNSTSITFDAAETRKAIHRLPEVVLKVDVTYSCFSGAVPHPPIDRFSLRLDDGDYGRRISAQGFDADQVDALASLVNSKLESSEKYFTGPSFRVNLGALISVGFVVIGSFGILLAYLQSKKLSPVILNPWITTLLTLAMPLGIVCTSNLFRWLQPILPGFAIYSGETSFIRRYAAEIGFLSLIIGLMALVIPLLKKPKFRLRFSGQSVEIAPIKQEPANDSQQPSNEL